MSASLRACASKPSKKFVEFLSPFNLSKHARAAPMASSFRTRATQASPLATRAACKHVWDRVEARSQTPAKVPELHSNAARPAPIVGSSSTIDAFARPAWRVVAYFATNCRRSSLLAFGVFVLGWGGARRNASAARVRLRGRPPFLYAQRCARALRAAPLRDGSRVRSVRPWRRATRCTPAALRDVTAAALRGAAACYAPRAASFPGSRALVCLECLKLDRGSVERSNNA